MSAQETTNTQCGSPLVFAERLRRCSEGHHTSITSGTKQTPTLGFAVVRIPTKRMPVTAPKAKSERVPLMQRSSIKTFCWRKLHCALHCTSTTYKVAAPLQTRNSRIFKSKESRVRQVRDGQKIKIKKPSQKSVNVKSGTMEPRNCTVPLLKRWTVYRTCRKKSPRRKPNTKRLRSLGPRKRSRIFRSNAQRPKGKHFWCGSKITNIGKT